MTSPRARTRVGVERPAADERHRPTLGSSPRPRSPPAAEPACELPRGGDQKVHRRSGRPAGGLDRLLRVRLAVPAAAGARHDPRLRATGRPGRAAPHPERGARSVPDHLRSAETTLADRLGPRACDRRARVAAGRNGHHRGHPERLQPDLERALQAPAELHLRAPARPRDAGDPGNDEHRLHDGRRLRRHLKSRRRGGHRGRSRRVRVQHRAVHDGVQTAHRG